MVIFPAWVNFTQYEKLFFLTMFGSKILESDFLYYRLFQEHWEGQRQFQQFAELADCYDKEDRMACLRNLPMDTIIDDIVPNMPTIHSPRLLLAAMPFSPVIDHVIIKKQPYLKLIAGEYDQSRDVMIGNTEHETEIFIRSIWPKGPINGVTYELAVRAIIQNSETSDQFLEKYPAACSLGRTSTEEEFPSLEQKDWEQKCTERLCGAIEGGCSVAQQATITQLCKTLNSKLTFAGKLNKVKWLSEAKIEVRSEASRQI